jgi:predicted glycoside hydrolase/deacetylase ChbG (UPF0249 family)
VSATGQKILVVNADDFGQFSAVTRGIIEAFERGIVTSSSMMVRWPDTKTAANYARANPSLAVGLHLDFEEWGCHDGEWSKLYGTVDLSDERAVTDEARRQLSLFQDLVGMQPSHLDSHQHLHLKEPLRSVAADIASEIGVPLRGCTTGIVYRGDFYGQDEQGRPYHQAITRESLIAVLRNLPEGITELGCHPGYAADLNTMYRNERELELRILCDPEVSAATRQFGFTLASFRELRLASQALPLER